MDEPETTQEGRSLDTEMRVAAAALAAAISPPLGIAVAAGSALRSPRVRQTLRKGTVNALANAIELRDRVASAAAERTGPPADEPTASASDEPAGSTQPG